MKNLSMVPKDEAIELEGEVVSIIGGGKYRVKLDDNEMEINAYAAGKIRKNNIKIIEWDRVKVELNEVDPTQGRIIYRFK